jgi:hypothetical protein
MSVSGEAGSKFWGRHFFDDMRASGLAKVQEAGNGENVISLSPEERQNWFDVGGKPIWAKWVKDMEAKGVKNAQEILDTTLQLGQE